MILYHYPLTERVGKRLYGRQSSQHEVCFKIFQNTYYSTIASAQMFLKKKKLWEKPLKEQIRSSHCIVNWFVIMFFYCYTVCSYCDLQIKLTGVSCSDQCIINWSHTTHFTHMKWRVHKWAWWSVSNLPNQNSILRSERKMFVLKIPLKSR